MKNHYKFIINKPFSFDNSNVRPIKLKNINKNQLKNSCISNNIHINNELYNTKRINECLKKVNNFSRISFWRICKKFIFQKKDEFINKIIILRKFIISEEIMFQYYYIIHSLKNPILEHNNRLKDFGFFKEENLMINQSIYYSKGNIII